MEPESSLLRSQEHTTGPYPGPDDSSPHLHVLFYEIHFNIMFPSTSNLSQLFLDQNCICMSQMRHSYLVSNTQTSFLDFLTFSYSMASWAALTRVELKIYRLISPSQFIFELIFIQSQTLCLYTFTYLINIRMFLARNMDANLGWWQISPLLFPFCDCYLIWNILKRRLRLKNWVNYSYRLQNTFRMTCSCLGSLG
jgi:hypothetical protein